MSQTFVTIDRRFNGPQGSANGGYAAGLLGRILPGAAQVTLRRPPPLATRLRLRRSGVGADARVILLIADTDADADQGLVAEASPAEPAQLTQLDPPIWPDLRQADAAAARHPGLNVRHPLSDCVVCGPGRADGFRLSTGPLDDAPDVGAAVFRPDPALAGPDGALPQEVIWAALDCPSFVPQMWARYLDSGTLSLLGRLSVVIERPVAATETLIVVGWALARDGRKDHTAAALLTPSGDVVARSRAVWITLRR